jgi:hypothetical protein
MAQGKAAEKSLSILRASPEQATANLASGACAEQISDTLPKFMQMLMDRWTAI